MASTLWLDESYSERYLTLGGFLCDDDEIEAIGQAWHTVKADLGLPEEAELKHNLPERHPSRLLLDAAGKSQEERLPLMLDAIRELPITIITTTLRDGRSATSRSILDIYPDAFRWIVRGATFVSPPPTQGPHKVVIDMPPSPPDTSRTALSPRMRKLLTNQGVFAFDNYRRLYAHPQPTERGGAWPALKNLGFMPCLLSSHAKLSDHLQIADVISGTVRSFVEHNAEGADGWGRLPEPTWRDENLKRILPRFRQHQGTVVNRGLGLFPSSELETPQLSTRISDLSSPGASVVAPEG